MRPCLPHPVPAPPSTNPHPLPEPHLLPPAYPPKAEPACNRKPASTPQDSSTQPAPESSRRVVFVRNQVSLAIPPDRAVYAPRRTAVTQRTGTPPRVPRIGCRVPIHAVYRMDGITAYPPTFTPGSALSEFHVSASAFQLPSACFFHTARYLPLSITGLPFLPLAGFVVIEYEPRS